MLCCNILPESALGWGSFHAMQSSELASDMRSPKLVWKSVMVIPWIESSRGSFGSRAFAARSKASCWDVRWEPWNRQAYGPSDSWVRARSLVRSYLYINIYMLWNLSIFYERWSIQTITMIFVNPVSDRWHDSKSISSSSTVSSWPSSMFPQYILYIELMIAYFFLYILYIMQTWPSGM